MSTLREAAQDALTAYETFRDVDDIDGLDDAMDRLRAALAEPKTELRDQHKAFTHWYFGLRGINEANFSPEDLAWAAWKAALARHVAEAVAKEREGCAKMADEYATWGGSNFYDWFKKLATAIRARAKKEME